MQCSAMQHTMRVADRQHKQSVLASFLQVAGVQHLEQWGALPRRQFSVVMGQDRQAPIKYWKVCHHVLVTTPVAATV